METQSDASKRGGCNSYIQYIYGGTLMVNGASGTVSLNDSEPLEIKKHAPLQIENVDMRVNILKEYISKSPNATLKDLKKSLDGFSKFTDDEFLNLLKEANLDKYNEIKPLYKTSKTYPVFKNNLPHVEVISTDVIAFGTPYSQDEINFLLKYDAYRPKNIFVLYTKAFPNSQRNSQFVTDCRHLIKKYPEKYIHKSKVITQNLTKPPVQQVRIQHTIQPTNQQLVAKTIRSLYKAGYTADTLPKVKPVINELISQNSDYAEIELAIEYLKP